MGLSVHQAEPFLGVSDLKFENCQNKGYPNIHLQTKDKQTVNNF